MFGFKPTVPELIKKDQLILKRSNRKYERDLKTIDASITVLKSAILKAHKKGDTNEQRKCAIKIQELTAQKRQIESQMNSLNNNSRSITNIDKVVEKAQSAQRTSVIVQRTASSNMINPDVIRKMYEKTEINSLHIDMADDMLDDLMNRSEQDNELEYEEGETKEDVLNNIISDVISSKLPSTPLLPLDIPFQSSSSPLLSSSSSPLLVPNLISTSSPSSSYNNNQHQQQFPPPPPSSSQPPPTLQIPSSSLPSTTFSFPSIPKDTPSLPPPPPLLPPSLFIPSEPQKILVPPIPISSSPSLSSSLRSTSTIPSSIPPPSPFLSSTTLSIPTSSTTNLNNDDYSLESLQERFNNIIK